MLAAFDGDVHAADVFEEATRVLGYDPRSRDDARSLASTVDAQIGLVIAGVASVRSLTKRGGTFDAVAGHSVGAFAAAVAARAMSFADALRVVSERARIMAELFPSGYGMGVLAGLQESAARRVVACGGDVYVANANAPLQFVLAGEVQALTRALEAGARAGARRADRLDVAVPSHCALLAPVARHLESVLADVPLRDPQGTFVGSVGARVIRDAETLRADLAAGVAHEVRWHDATTLLAELGATIFLEAVPGHVLTDLAAAAFPRVRAIALEDAGAESAVALMKRA